ncbi:hypothetical protein [Kineobactrum salinum]|uniref:Uncharacterized protein n=1 Tax=Kineobactrum salinum TaxID=2708301 RepID=A0A6C0U1C6_9GAMM|nr:hypothetical protein [Kineobactrum salinum]QIB65910.1 hypothetical protein G3T16_11250 [Kineobactrum salinum]
MEIEIVMDGALRVLRTSVCIALDSASADLAAESLDKVYPGSGHWREMHMDARASYPPISYCRSRVSPINSNKVRICRQFEGIDPVIKIPLRLRRSALSSGSHATCITEVIGNSSALEEITE